tara:strand:- start:8890 stop:11820 length:2931 start_codon:yes stop_codon:yes gene_type:complete
MARLLSIPRSGVALLLCVLVALLSIGSLAEAAIERYDYDALGRLVRFVDGDSQVTEYEYDAVGNILSVKRLGEVQPPQVSGVNPPSVRRLESARIVVSGNNLSGMSVISPDKALAVSRLQVEPSAISFDLAPSGLAPMGPQNFRIQGASGTADFSITVNPVLPTVAILPGPIAVPPDGTPRNFVVTLSSADTMEHVIALSSSNPAVATITPDTVTIGPGETQAAVQISGLQAGLAAIALTSSNLRAVSVPVFVTAEFSGLTTSHAPQLGVVIESGVEPGAEPVAVTSSRYGVAFGPYLESVIPQAVSVGTQSHTLTLAGGGLAGVTGISVIPSDGLDIGLPVVAPGGETVTVELNVAEDAPQTLRRVVLTGEAGAYPPVEPGADRFLVSAPVAEIDSISPLFATPGTTNLTLTIRGRNLQRANAVSLLPGNGLTVGATPQVNVEGTLATVDVAVSPFATTSNHAVVVHTPAGSSSEVASAANTFRVTEEHEEFPTPVVSSILGVQLLGDEPPASAGYELRSLPVGIAVGPVITRTSPRFAVVGETTELQVHGESLTDVSAISFEPATGLEQAELVVSADGKTLTVALTVASDAPLLARRLRVVAEDAQIPFADPQQATVNIVLPPPEILSVSPLMLEQGSTGIEFLLRGRNLAGAQSVTFEPADGVIASPPVVSADGLEARVSLSVAADAQPGTRTVVVATPAGPSSTVPAAANTVEIVTKAASTISPIVSSPLGVVLADLVGEEPVNLVPLVAPLLGVELLPSEPEPAVSRAAYSRDLGVSLGAALTSVETPPLLPGATVTANIRGIALQGMDSVQVMPATGISLSEPVVAADGLSASVEITLAANVEAGQRMLVAYEGQQKVFAQPAMAGQINVAIAEPSIVSISPILGYQGDTLKMIVRGTNLQGAGAVLIEPGAGLSIDSHPVVNALGTELTLDIHIEPDAPLGSRVLRVQTPGGVTSSDPIPANTFTVFPQ